MKNGRTNSMTASEYRAIREFFKYIKEALEMKRKYPMGW